MGQKVNPLIFRIGLKDKLWNSQYLSKNLEESAHYLFQDIEIRKYIDKIFKRNDMIVHNCTIKRSNLRLSVFVNFYTTSKASIRALQFFSNISNFKSRVLRVKRHVRSSRTFFFNFVSIKNKLKGQLAECVTQNKEIKHIQENVLSYSQMKSKITKTLLSFSNVLEVTLHLNNIQTKILYNLYRNKHINFSPALQELKIYSHEIFFNEMIEILIVVFSTRDTAKLLVNFIAFQFQIMKRHNTLLTFLKRAVLLLNNIKYFQIHGIKISISGKFNGAPRAKRKSIQTGKLPLQNFKSKMDYHDMHAFTPYGTFGVKVWICEK